MSLEQVYKDFPKKEDCIALLENYRWDSKPLCPYCGSEKFSTTKKAERYHCNNCNMSYSVTVNTIFHRTRLDLQKWFHAIHHVLGSATKISSRELAKEIETTKDTAWLILKKIRQSILEGDTLIQNIYTNENSNT